MEDNLYNNLQNYCSLIDYASKATSKIIYSIEEEMWSNVEFNILNRDRIISQIENTQGAIESELQNLIASNSINLDIKHIIKSWSEDTNKWIIFTMESDQNILLKLQEHKSSTSLELAKLFKSKQAFKGYDLSSTTP